MDFYQYPKCLLDNVDLMLDHNVFIATSSEEGDCMSIFGPSRTHKFIIAYAPVDYGAIVLGKSTIVNQEPFYMDWPTVCQYIKYHNERSANASNT